MFDNHENIDLKLFVTLFNNRVKACALQILFGDIERNEILKSLYIHLKPEFGISNYLLRINSFKLRKNITRLRISSHNLFIETFRRGRTRLPRSGRLGTDIEDEFHFIMLCKNYSDLREKFIPEKKIIQKPSMFKFIELLRSNNRSTLLNLGNSFHTHFNVELFLFLSFSYKIRKLRCTVFA